MKSVLTGIALTLIISTVAWAVWDNQTLTTAERYASQDNVRLD